MIFRTFKDTIIPGYVNRLKGLTYPISAIDNIWCGDFLRQDTTSPWPELFIYSKRDFYIPWQVFERDVLEPRRRVGREVFTLRCEKSRHVAHLRKYGGEYREAILNFVHHAYFAKLKKQKKMPILEPES